MEPSAAKTALKVLGLCTALLFLVAVAAVAVAVAVWHSDGGRQLKGCRERAANQTVALVDRGAELEREQAERGRQLEKLAQRERDLQRQLSQAKDGRRRLNATLMGCLENMTLLDANLSSLHNEIFTLQAEGTQMGSRNGALLAEMAQWQEQVEGLQERLQEAWRARSTAVAEKEHCAVQQNALQETLHSYLAEIASLQRRLRDRSSSSSSARRRCPPFRYLLWGLACFCVLYPLVSFGAERPIVWGDPCPRGGEHPTAGDRGPVLKS